MCGVYPVDLLGEAAAGLRRQVAAPVGHRAVPARGLVRRLHSQRWQERDDLSPLACPKALDSLAVSLEAQFSKNPPPPPISLSTHIAKQSWRHLTPFSSAPLTPATVRAVVLPRAVWAASDPLAPPPSPRRRRGLTHNAAVVIASDGAPPPPPPSSPSSSPPSPTAGTPPSVAGCARGQQPANETSVPELGEAAAETAIAHEPRDGPSGGGAGRISPILLACAEVQVQLREARGHGCVFSSTVASGAGGGPPHGGNPPKIHRHPRRSVCE